MIPGEPAGADPGGGKVRRTPTQGTARGWASGEHPLDCLRKHAGALSYRDEAGLSVSCQ